MSAAGIESMFIEPDLVHRLSTSLCTHTMITQKRAEIPFVEDDEERADSAAQIKHGVTNVGLIC